MNILELCREMGQDDLELGLRVACALYVENETTEENFINILKWRYKMKR